jgi:asparagine synthase (glutamine-hydrolysing)
VEHFSDRFPGGAPILHLDGADAVVDALLYNRDELEQALELAPDCGLSDEELLLKLVGQKGWKALAMVNGDFAGAVWDREKGTWTLFRDHLGVRPLYCILIQNTALRAKEWRDIDERPDLL